MTMNERQATHVGDGHGSRPSVFDLVERQYERAAERNLRRIVLEFQPVGELVAACGRIFASLDRDDEFQRRVARKVWLVKSSALQTVLPFNDPRLALSGQACELDGAAETLPRIRRDAVILRKLLGELSGDLANPKREWFLNLAAEMRSRRKATAVLAGLQGAGTPGWPADLTAETDEIWRGVSLIRTRKDLRDRVFDSVVIPGNTSFTSRPLVQDLLYGGRARDAFLVTYRGERALVPVPLSLPTNRIFHARAVPSPPIVETDAAAVDSQLDIWANHALWQEIRARQADMAPMSERDITVSARFVVFVDGRGTFLPEDRRVVEISDLLDSGGDFSAKDEELPRKAARDLEEGDLLLLRLAGGGHYVEDVADGLMVKAGLQKLRHEATEWKEILHRILKKRGDGYVAKAARDVGLRIRNANYLWQWAGDAVMAPHNLQTFSALIKTLFRLDPSEHRGDPDEYALKRWQQMERVKSFHMRAGVVIRNALLERVRQFVAERTPIVSSASVELPGLEAGRMGLLRVAAVDTKTMMVPLSRLFHLVSVKVA